MANEQIFEFIEIDVDYCSLTFGSGACSATLGSGVSYKCFNTYATCPKTNLFTKSVKTLRYGLNRADTPLGMGIYPFLKSVSAISSTINISGVSDSQGFLGRRATLSATFEDAVDADTMFDKYVLERKSGAAQFSGVGYDPVNFGTHFSKLKARWPYYAGRPLRYVTGYLVNGEFVANKTRHYIITNIKGPDDSGKVTVEAKDILALADNKKALAPKPSRGKLASSISHGNNQSFYLLPYGIGAEYPTSGYASVGSEVVTFSRSNDYITLTSRGLRNTNPTSHSANETFQLSLRLDNVRVDDFVYDMLVNYSNIPASFCPKDSKWKPLVDRWASGVLLNTTIVKATGVTQLLGELAVLGFSLWWDEAKQEILLLPNVPVTQGEIIPINEDFNLLSISQEDKEEDRITQVHFYSKQTDPNKPYDDKTNYTEVPVIIDTTAEGANAFNGSKIKEVFCRWFDDGNEAVVRAMSIRLLRRFNKTPIHYTFKLNVKDDSITLGSVIRLSSDIVASPTGHPVEKLVQVYRKNTTNKDMEFEVTALNYQFDGRFGYTMPNGSPTYLTATPEQKATGCFAAPASLVFPDNTEAYEAI